MEKDNFFLFENDTISLAYTFWGENGNLLIAIENRLDKPIYIDWKRSSYIPNGKKQDYYSEIIKEISNNKTLKRTYDYFIRDYYKKAKGITVMDKQERITFIPPRSVFMRAIPKLTSVIQSMAGSEQVWITKGNKQKLVRETVFYNLLSSPFILRNYITYSTDENFTSEFFIDNEFYLSSVEEVHDTCIFKKIKDKQTLEVTNYEADLDGKSFYIKNISYE